MNIRAYARTMRPRHWAKNVFVFAGLLFGHSIFDPLVVIAVLKTFGAFCLAASSVYVVNDIGDREADREHQYKRRRPIASGEISPLAAAIFAATLLAVSLGLASTVSVKVIAIIVVYVGMNLAYSAGLKHVVILDVFIIAAGFLLRILAGTVGVGMAPSEWLFLCSLCLTLFLGFGKRRAELGESYEEHGETGDRRSVLLEYDTTALDAMMASMAACTFVTYGLFTMSDSTVAQHGSRNLVYTLPFVIYAMFRYFYIVHRRGKGSDPTEDLVTDRHILIAGAAWLLATFLIIQ